MTCFPLEGEEIVISGKYFSHTGEASIFTKGKKYKFLVGTIGNGSVDIEDDKGIIRHINPLYLRPANKSGRLAVNEDI